MLNYNSEHTDDRSIQANRKSIERHIDDDHYVRRFAPAAFILDGVATQVQIPAAAPQWPAVKFPNGVISIAVASWGKPSQWRSGRLRIQFRYTSDVGGTANFSIRYRIRAIRDGEVHPGTLLTADPVLLSLAGPAVANTHIKTANFYTTVSFGSDDEQFSLQVFRDGGGDANNNDFFLVSVEIEHIQAVRESQ